MPSVFFSYSPVDELLRDQVEAQLSLLKRQGIINTWHDRRIEAGDDLGRAIDRALEDADVILLLISHDFLASEYCYGVEMRRAMERHETGQAVVIPVILRACDWHDAPFGKLLALPTDGKPITQWADRDQALLEVAMGVRRAVGNRADRRSDVEMAAARAPGRRATGAPVGGEASLVGTKWRLFYEGRTGHRDIKLLAPGIAEWRPDGLFSRTSRATWKVSGDTLEITLLYDGQPIAIYDLRVRDAHVEGTITNLIRNRDCEKTAGSLQS
jgi:hypothetical protein